MTDGPLACTPLLAGLATGAVISLVIDEGLTTALGFSAPNDQYPAVTHARGFAAHLVYGLSPAVAAEALGKLARISSPR